MMDFFADKVKPHTHQLTHIYIYWWHDFVFSSVHYINESVIVDPPLLVNIFLLEKTKIFFLITCGLLSGEHSQSKNCRSGSFSLISNIWTKLRVNTVIHVNIVNVIVFYDKIAAHVFKNAFWIWILGIWNVIILIRLHCCRVIIQGKFL